MNAPQLGIDHEDLGFDILPAVEKSFGISFTQNDFHENFTYGELHALICTKLPTAVASDCTTQQAFYKLRQSLRPLVGEAEIRPNTLLANLLPVGRREAAAHLHTELDIDLALISMPTWAVLVGSFLILASLVLFFFNGLLALAGLGLAVMGLDAARHLNKQFNYQTVREVVEQMSSHYYRQSRRNPDTVNPQEVASRLARIFIEMAGLEASELVPNAIL
ncbi:MAG: hypothetical protein EOO60_13555 [Hymenobacter sp.]|nr:MAG: hypothetical protein EOO60_13555 [Hymenobacter sp.]